METLFFIQLVFNLKQLSKKSCSTMIFLSLDSSKFLFEYFKQGIKEKCEVAH